MVGGYVIYIIIIIIKVVTPAGSAQRYYIGRGLGEGKHGKVGVKRKWWILAQPPLFPARKQEAATQGEPI